MPIDSSGKWVPVDPGSVWGPYVNKFPKYYNRFDQPDQAQPDRQQPAGGHSWADFRMIENQPLPANLPHPVPAPAPAAPGGWLRTLGDIFNQASEGLIRGVTFGLGGQGGPIARGIARLFGNAPEASPVPQTHSGQVAANVGEILGAIAPIGGLEKTVGQLGEAALKHFAPRLAGEDTVGNLARALARGIPTGAAYQGITAAAQGDSPENIARQAGMGAAFFGAAGPAGEAVGGLADRLLPGLADSLAGRIITGAVREAAAGATGMAASLPFYSPDQRPTVGDIGRQAGSLALFEALSNALGVPVTAPRETETPGNTPETAAGTQPAPDLAELFSQRPEAQTGETATIRPAQDFAAGQPDRSIFPAMNYGTETNAPKTGTVRDMPENTPATATVTPKIETPAPAAGTDLQAQARDKAVQKLIDDAVRYARQAGLNESASAISSRYEQLKRSSGEQKARQALEAIVKRFKDAADREKGRLSNAIKAEAFRRTGSQPLHVAESIKRGMLDDLGIPAVEEYKRRFLEAAPTETATAGATEAAQTTRASTTSEAQPGAETQSGVEPTSEEVKGYPGGKVAGMPAQAAGATGAAGSVESPGAAAPQPASPGAPIPRTPVSKLQILKAIENRLDMPLFTGRMTLKGAAGEYHVQSGHARTKVQGDLQAVAHELGHHIAASKTIDLTGKQYPELEALGKQLYPKAPPEKQVNEGFAEFINKFIADPQTLPKEAPNFLNGDFATFLKDNPEIRDALYEVRGLYQSWFGQDPVSRIAGHIVGMKAAEAKKWLTPKERLYSKIYDSGFGLLKLVQESMGASRVQRWRGIGERPGDFGLDALQNPYVLYRTVGAGRFGKIQQFLVHDAETPDGQFIPGLLKILQPVREHINIPVKPEDQPGLFETYLVAKRAQELHGRGIKTGMDDADVNFTVNRLEREHPEFVEAADKLYRFNDNIIAHLVDAGLLSEDGAAVMRDMNRYYVPFHRLFESEAGGPGAGSGRRVVDTGRGIRSIKGSERMILHPLETMYKNTIYLLDLAARNKVGRAVADLADRSQGLGDLIHRMPTPVKPVQADVEKIADILKDAGVDINAIGGRQTLEKMATSFMPAGAAMGKERKENIAVVMRDGQPTFYRMHPELYRILEGMDEKTAGLVGKVFSGFTRALRAGSVLTPEFMGRNPIRDILHAMTMGGFNPANFVEGVFHAVRQDDVYKRWAMSGGMTSTFVSSDQDFISSDLRKRLKNSQTAAEKLGQLVKKPVEILQALSNFMEEGTRLGSFARAERTALQQGASPEEARIRGAYTSREASVDFGRSGPFSREYNRYVSFFNAAMQGPERIWREFKRNPHLLLLRGFTYITLPTIALYLRNRNDQRYKDLPQYERDMYWIIPTKNTLYKIPKPFEVGLIFGTLPERILRAIDQHDPQAFQGFADTAWQVLTPSIVPTAFTPWLEATFNRSFFTGLPLVPAADQKLEPGQQYDSRTSAVLRALGQTFNVSPMYLQNYVQGYTGGLGIHFLNFLDYLATKSGAVQDIPQPAQGIGGLPLIQGFIAHPKPGGDATNRFYDRYNELEQKYQTAMRLYETGQPIPDNLKVPLGELRRLRSAATKIGKLHTLRRQVDLSRKLTPEQKRVYLDRIDAVIGQIAAQAMGQGSQ